MQTRPGQNQPAACGSGCDSEVGTEGVARVQYEQRYSCPDAQLRVMEERVNQSIVRGVVACWLECSLS